MSSHPKRDCIICKPYISTGMFHTSVYTALIMAKTTPSAISTGDIVIVLVRSPGRNSKSEPMASIVALCFLKRKQDETSKEIRLKNALQKPAIVSS